VKAAESLSGLSAEGLVMDEAELPRLCRRAWLDGACCDREGPIMKGVSCGRAGGRGAEACQSK
jgi:hypothetical protein